MGAFPKFLFEEKVPQNKDDWTNFLIIILIEILEMTYY